MLFYVLWVCLAKLTKNNSINLQETLIYMQKINLIPLFFLKILHFPALIQAVFHVGAAFGCEKIGAQKIKTFFFQNKFYSLKTHAHYFTIFLYLAPSRAAKLGIFIHFTFTNLPRCSQKHELTNICILYTDLQLLFMSA